MYSPAQLRHMAMQYLLAKQKGDARAELLAMRLSLRLNIPRHEVDEQIAKLTK